MRIYFYDDVWMHHVIFEYCLIINQRGIHLRKVSMMQSISSLKNHLLIAMPNAHHDYFDQSVIYICEHQPQGSVGLMINQPMPYSLAFLFEQLSIESTDKTQSILPLLFGGPMQTERGFVIHRPFGHWQSSLLLSDEVTITTSNDIIRAFAKNDGPKSALITLGFVGWDGGQLEKEILENVWLVCPYQSTLLYELPFEQRWEHAALSIGVKFEHFIQGDGHA
jgi:putative transcriptional regulator